MFRFVYICLGVGITSALLFASCASTGGNQGNGAAFTGPFLQYDSVWNSADKYSDKVEIRYAKGLKVDYRKDGVHVFISNPDPKAANKSAEELVIPHREKPGESTTSGKNIPPKGGLGGSPKGKHAESTTSGKDIPPTGGLGGSSQRFICTTALQLGNFEVLGMEKYIVGCNSLKNVFSPKIKQQMADGTTKRIGKEGNFDLEAIIAAKPDYIFVSASKYGGFESLKECGIPLIPHHGYKETDPLGQAEWIKLIGLLTGETKRANAVFSDIENKYLTLKAMVAKAAKTSIPGREGKSIPTVLSGRQVRDGWYFMGGRSYMARIFADAGADYIMKDNAETGGMTLDFESVYARGIKADFWQMDGTFEEEFTLDALSTDDARYADIKAYKEPGHCLFCNFAFVPYRELGGMEPQILLADFVKVFHPELLPKYEPKYYKPMR